MNVSADCGRFGRPRNGNDDRFIVMATLFAEPGRWLNGYCTVGAVGRLSRVARFICFTKTNIFI